MKERPILFSAPMVRVLLEGRKTQTRRAVKPQPKPFTVDCVCLPEGFPDEPWCWIAQWLDESGAPLSDEQQTKVQGGWPDCSPQFKCPYGKPGDRLWVKEAYWAWGKWVPNGLTKGGRKAWRFMQVGTSIRYVDGNRPTATAFRDGECGWVYRHGRFMPKAHSRLTQEITEVRVQRLRDISVRDAIAEGCEPLPPFPASVCAPEDYIPGYRKLWESINGAGSWAVNPWVWAISFKAVAA